MSGDRAAEDKFPEGLRVLVVDDDRVCLKVLEALLRHCKYQLLSVDCDKKVVMKGIDHGASDFMVKPVRTHELKNIWQHVQRWRNPKAISHISDHDNDVQRVQPATTDKSKYSGNKRNVGDDSSENNEGTHISAIHRKPRMTWTIALHNKFLEAINQIGLDSKNSHLVPHSSTMLVAARYFH
ncbi:two-component response regulator ORR22-like [Aegilops tauschii subsp. strangulata]|uniref:two-component response regulator ORR22-like n=1 Tax=Aegilops tauschii subsp. strangulata TaxID=200361 RepID=UPI003CC8DF42